VNDYGSNVPILIGFGALALVLVALTRGRLGYQRYREEVPDPAQLQHEDGFPILLKLVVVNVVESLVNIVPVQPGLFARVLRSRCWARHKRGSQHRVSGYKTWRSRLRR